MPNFPVCISLLTLQVLSFNPSVFCYCHLLHTRTDTHSLFLSDVCERLRFSAPSSLFPPACVNVRASCCSSQTTQWETDQPHRRGNPLFWLKEKARAEKKGTFMHPNPLLVPSSPCIVARLWTMWPGSQASLRLQRRKRGVLQLLRRQWGNSCWMLLKY